MRTIEKIKNAMLKTENKCSAIYLTQKSLEDIDTYPKNIGTREFLHTKIDNRELRITIIENNQMEHVVDCNITIEIDNKIVIAKEEQQLAAINNYTPIHTNTPKEDLE